MALKDILVFLDSEGPSDGRLVLAAKIARDHGARLDAAFVPTGELPDFPPGLSVPRRTLVSDGRFTLLENDDLACDRQAGAVEHRFRERLRLFGLEGDWCQLDPVNSREIIAHARAADLIVLGQTEPHEPCGRSWCPKWVVVNCGRPALVVPYAGQFSHVGRRVLIAWDDSREVVRAINDALPLIHGAEAVIVVTAHSRRRNFDRNRLALSQIARHLTRHDILARSVEALSTGYAAADILLSRAVDLEADLIVAGAHRHSRLREALTGGVSRGLFYQMTIPVLMSH